MEGGRNEVSGDSKGGERVNWRDSGKVKLIGLNNRLSVRVIKLVRKALNIALENWVNDNFIE